MASLKLSLERSAVEPLLHVLNLMRYGHGSPPFLPHAAPKSTCLALTFEGEYRVIFIKSLERQLFNAYNRIHPTISPRRDRELHFDLPPR